LKTRHFESILESESLSEESSALTAKLSKASPYRRWQRNCPKCRLMLPNLRVRCP
jgi:hypothetical protein